MAAIRMNNGVPILNGTTLAFDDDENCCCSTAPASACISVNCPNVNRGLPTGGVWVNPPNMEVTLTTADVNLPLTWCGKTWIKSSVSKVGEQYYSGEGACICPNLRYQRYTYSSGGSTSAIEAWAIPNLLIARDYIITGTLANLLQLSGGNFTGPKKDSYLATFGVPFTTVTTLGVITPVSVLKQQPTPGSYRLTNPWVDNTYVNGPVTYTWTRGERWV